MFLTSRKKYYPLLNFHESSKLFVLKYSEDEIAKSNKLQGPTWLSSQQDPLYTTQIP